MAFFGLTDIKFNQIEKRNFGPLAALEGSPFQKSTLKYPSDVGDTPKGHYMVFFIREQVNSSFKAKDRGGQSFSAEDEQAVYDALQNSTKFAGGGISAGKTTFADKINGALTSAISKGTSALTSKFGSGGVAGKVAGGIDGFVKGPQPQEQLKETSSTPIEDSVKSITDKNKKALGFLRRTQLTNDAIALYMPDTINFDSSADYTTVGLGDEALAQLLVAAPNLVKQFRENPDPKLLMGAALKSGLVQNKAQGVAEKLGAGKLGRVGLYAATGGVTNPMIEMIYSSPTHRSFQFEFFFYARDESEAYAVQKIIDRFRFHQSPELQGGLDSQMGLLIPPSEFDIKFFYAGKQNPNIPPIGTCVLKQIQVNFAPKGWTAYETVGENSPALGRTGMPVVIQMSLHFTETTIITKEDFKSQGMNGGPMPGVAAYSDAGRSRNVFNNG
jgi:hypothetical protein